MFDLPPTVHAYCWEVAVPETVVPSPLPLLLNGSHILANEAYAEMVCVTSSAAMTLVLLTPFHLHSPFSGLIQMHTETLETTGYWLWVPDILPTGKQPAVSNAHAGLDKYEKYNSTYFV